MTTKIFLAVVSVLVSAYLMGIVIISAKFKTEVQSMYSRQKTNPVGVFDYRQLAALPKPVRLYFMHILPPGQPYIYSVAMKHSGQFKTSLNGRWSSISGKEYFSAPTPGFVWKGNTSLFTARDMFIGGKGRLVVSIFSIFKIQDRQGAKYDEGELLRWLGESVIFPTNLLPSNDLRWIAVDDSTAQLTYRFNKININYDVIFNDKHEISQMRVMRYMDDGTKHLWINKLSNYKKLNGMLVPTLLEAGWRLRGRYFPYARFRIEEIKFNKASKFTLHRENIYE